MDFIEQYLRFIKEAERLKAVTRTAWTHDGRRESTAEHSWRLALFAGLAAGRLPGLNREKVLMMSLIHDMGELYGGDISAALCPDPQEKTDEESRAVRKAFSLLPGQHAKAPLPEAQAQAGGRLEAAGGLHAQLPLLLAHNDDAGLIHPGRQ